jgi:beta-galactosidase
MLTTSGNQFLLNDNPFRILSGSIHYFRVMSEYWRDRLEKAKAFGLNTIETYVAWNLHEPRPGEFYFNGMLDLVRFIETAAAMDLKVILRPGPYICSEWDFGGLPAWLLKDPHMQVRCMYPLYLEAVDRYFDSLLRRITPLLVSNGGPIIAVQVENEYGGFGNDQEYLQYLADGLRNRGVDVFLFTSDGPYDHHMQGGSLPNLHKTANFAYRARPAFAKLRQYQPDGPLMVTEFWSGWFDHWGEFHHISMGGLPTSLLSQWTLDKILASGASVNFYMFHGGTNFGFMNGANRFPWTGYLPDVTSYDYDAPLDEAGDASHKFLIYGNQLRHHIPGLPPLIILQPVRKRAFGPVQLTERLSLFDALGEKHLRPTPEPMEAFDQAYGFILYRTQVSGPRPAAPLEILELHDRAQVFLNGQPTGILEREFPKRKLSITIPAGGATLDILVENMGRVNFGLDLLDRKGITSGVALGKQFLFGWEIYPLPLDDLSALNFVPFDRFEAMPRTSVPGFWRGAFPVDDPADTFLALPGWTKGVVWVNGFNLGRYWRRGPQQTLYVPAPLLRKGRNEIVVLELHGQRQPVVEFVPKPDLKTRRW